MDSQNDLVYLFKFEDGSIDLICTLQLYNLHIVYCTLYIVHTLSLQWTLRMSRWIHLNGRKRASIYSDLLPNHVRGAQGERTKYKMQIWQKYNYMMSFAKLKEDKIFWFKISLGRARPDQRQDLNLSIYFYDVFMWHPGWTEGGGSRD